MNVSTHTENMELPICIPVSHKCVFHQFSPGREILRIISVILN